MADYTQILAIDNAGPNADGSYNIPSLDRPFKRVTVQEDYDSQSAPTTDLRAKAPAAAANFVKVSQGVPYVYTPVGKSQFDANETPGTIKTRAGSINLQLVYSMQI